MDIFADLAKTQYQRNLTYKITKKMEVDNYVVLTAAVLPKEHFDVRPIEVGI